MEIVPGVYGIDCNGRVWAYLVRTGSRWTLIDAGYPADLPLIEAELAALDAKVSHIGQIVLTHCHVDHMGTVAEIQRRAEVETLAHRLDAPIIRGQAVAADPVLSEQERKFMEQMDEGGGISTPEPARIDRELEDGQAVRIGDDDAVVVHVPGHTDGSIALCLPSRGLLFTGDAVASMGKRPIVGVFNIDPRRARESFKRLSDLEFEAACFGHGPPIITGAAQIMRKVAGFL
jgi:glyoxylase-like metal-dependent hydrolase (beta-lactamase superfamily II)